jgi:hypothetical protein
VYTQKRRIDGGVSVSISGASLTTEDRGISRIDDGQAFTYSSGAELSAGQMWEMWLQSPAAVSATVLLQWRATGSFILNIYENATPTGAYTTVTAANLNRNNSSPASTVIRFSDTQAASLGLHIFNQIIDAPESMPFQPVWNTHQMVLKTGQEDYLLRFYNDDTILGRVVAQLIIQEA